MDDKILTQDDVYNYKYVSTLNIDHLRFMLVDIEVERDLHNWWLSNTLINKINELGTSCTEIRVYFSEKTNEFIIEPFNNSLRSE